MLCFVYSPLRPRRAQMFTGTRYHLPGIRLAGLERSSNLRVIGIEHLSHQERYPPSGGGKDSSRWRNASG